MTRYFTIHIEPAEEGGFCVSVPALPGCFTQGETIEEAMTNAQEAIEGHIQVLKDHGVEVPSEREPEAAINAYLRVTVPAA